MITVIICTHNPRADYLRRTIDSLKAQTLPIEQWELLLVDNASSVPLAAGWDLSWHPLARLIREEKLGLTPARLRGIRESTGELLLFVDDDNVLASDYCKEALRIGNDFPNVGCFGAGRIDPEYETTPPHELLPYLPSLALRTITRTVYSDTPEDGLFPYGAGLVVRRQIAQAYAAHFSRCHVRQMLDRRGNVLNSGGDDEFSWTASDLGYGIGLFFELQLVHLIASRRMSRAYLLRIEEGHAFSHTLLKWLHARPALPPPPPRSPFVKIVRAILMASPSPAFHQGQGWWNELARKKMTFDFALARRHGVDRAWHTIRLVYKGSLSGQDSSLSTIPLGPPSMPLTHPDRT